MTQSIEAAIALRSAGQAGQARSLLFELLAEDEANAGLHIRLACTYDVLGLEREAVLPEGYPVLCG
ncbi:hypothetical protein [Paenibacillus sp. S150]|uniref:hypothetical protein n=1 Tax=Paenibacillus sp. S150 TaxID=2749826 RepID=UPI001C59648D|nr:hypothetical protein [Paenibacillus sp. S150]MBW4083198.1 hypothetical protein [Paenibacillus sp. S150]